ncbi:MAG TPA: 7TM-DISM domain-containing protein [Haloferula sp.]
MRKAKSGFLTIWLWVLALGLAGAQSVVLSSEQDSLSLTPQLSLLRDPEGKLALQDVQAADFERAGAEHLHRGFDRAAYWLKVPLVSGDPVEREWLVELGHTRFEHLDWYLVKDGRVLRHVAMGNRRPRDPWSVPDRFPVLRLSLEAGESLDLLVRVQTSTQVRIALRAYTPLAYAARRDVAGSVYLACFGAMAVLGAIGLVYGLSTGFRGAFAYAASALTIGLIFLGTSGYWVSLDLPGATFGANEGVAVFNALTQIAILAYVRAFFELRERMPRMDVVAKAGIAIGLLLLAAMTVISYQAMLQAANLYAAAVALFSVVAAVLAMVRRMKIARIYLLAWLPFWISNLIHLLSLWRLVETRENPEYRVVALAVVSATLFFLAMADRTRQHRRERDEAQARLLEKERDENQRLEVLVEERTAGLLEAKELAERANHAKEMFLANISHEIRTPLSALVGLSQAMCKQSERRQLPEDFTRMLRQIRSGGSHLNLMLTNLLDLSSLNAGRPLVRNSPVDLAAWSRSVRDIVEPFAAAKGLELRWTTACSMVPSFPATRCGCRRSSSTWSTTRSSSPRKEPWTCASLSMDPALPSRCWTMAPACPAGTRPCSPPSSKTSPCQAVRIPASGSVSTSCRGIWQKPAAALMPPPRLPAARPSMWNSNPLSNRHDCAHPDRR